ncbi:mitochondrial carrier domain-containing protein [Zopfochytrium polystomum]|nr:mitochondrial carrier domain-containing protein [Zopfochytrium polystomum]
MAAGVSAAPEAVLSRSREGLPLHGSPTSPAVSNGTTNTASKPKSRTPLALHSSVAAFAALRLLLDHSNELDSSSSRHGRRLSRGHPSTQLLKMKYRRTRPSSGDHHAPLHVLNLLVTSRSSGFEAPRSPTTISRTIAPHFTPPAAIGIMDRTLNHDKSSPELGPDGEPVDLTPGVLAGIAKSFVTRSSFALVGFGKGLLKWWFRVPIKLFRPSVVNPMLVFNMMAEAEGKKVSAGYVRNVVREEGFQLISKNMLPLLICNSIVGAVLFNVYTATADHLEALAAFDSSTPTTVFHHMSQFSHHFHPFFAGAVAGLAQSVLATPLDNVTRRVNPEVMAARRGEGMIGLAIRAVREAMPPALGPLPRWVGGRLNRESVTRDLINIEGRLRFFWEGWWLNAFKDSLGFALFFGFFETTRKHGKHFVVTLHEQYFQASAGGNTDSEASPGEKPRRPLFVSIGQVTAVIIAGALAGAGYQLVIYPFDRLPHLVPADATDGLAPPGSVKGKVDWPKTYEMATSRAGLRILYQGLGSQLVRIAPPSAIGLLIYEIANSQLWEDEDV